MSVAPVVCEINLGDIPEHVLVARLDALRDEFEPHVIHCTEGGDRIRLLRLWAADHGYVVFEGDGTPGAASVPFLVRKHGVRVHGHGTVLAVKRRKVGRGAGPSTSKTKVINWVIVQVLDETTGAWGLLWQIFGTHMIASAMRPFAWLRRIHYRRHMRVIVHTIRDARIHRMLLVMDGNCDPGHKLEKPLRDLGLRQLVHEPTHDAHTYDQGWTNQDGDASTIDGSDHRWVGIRLRDARPHAA